MKRDGERERAKYTKEREEERKQSVGICAMYAFMYTMGSIAL